MSVCVSNEWNNDSIYINQKTWYVCRLGNAEHESPELRLYGVSSCGRTALLYLYCSIFHIEQSEQNNAVRDNQHVYRVPSNTLNTQIRGYVQVGDSSV